MLPRGDGWSELFLNNLDQHDREENMYIQT